MTNGGICYICVCTCFKGIYGDLTELHHETEWLQRNPEITCNHIPINKPFKNNNIRSLNGFKCKAYYECYLDLEEESNEQERDASHDKGEEDKDTSDKSNIKTTQSKEKSDNKDKMTSPYVPAYTLNALFERHDGITTILKVAEKSLKLWTNK